MRGGVGARAAGIRVIAAAPWVAGAIVSLALLSYLPPPMKWPGSAPGARAPSRESAWRGRRRDLEAASRARRAGHVDEALGVYRDVVTAPDARADDRSEASMWWARLRIERGEWSGLIDLERWIATRPDPAWLARTALMLRRVQTGLEVGAERAEVVRVAALVERELTSIARFEDIDGERARRWSDRIGITR
ncbi:MAG: hypothetical protein VX015_11285 [Planctomycetota bacterium]|nr:hypothetical protein [Planctomycetota bacterium]MEC8512719.1 hypothetical protein [Planctomycetota bacterium]